MVDVPAEKQQLTGAEDVTWDLSVFYDSLDDPRIQQEIDELHTLVDDFTARYKGQVAALSASDFVAAFEAMEVLYDLRGRIGSFAGLNFSTNTGDPQYGAFLQKITELGSELSQKLVFFDLEWNEMDDDAAQKILDDPALGKFRYHLHAERRYKPYQLSEIEEQLLIEKSVTGNNAWTRLFTQITSAFRFDYDGEEINLMQLLSKIHEPDREIRERAQQMVTDKLEERSMELTYIFNVLAADKAASDKRRGYATWVSSRNLSNKAPDEVVEALIDTVTSNYDLVARHYELKRALLGYDELFDYDRYAPLDLKESDQFYTWDEAKQIVLNAFQAFSPTLAESAQQFFDNNWIHAPVLPGKRGGAFASPSVPSAHPFIFVNYTGKANDVMTLAHELGHGVHTDLSSKKQGLFGLYTPLTTAETASVFAEMLVFQDLMSKEPDKEVQLAMLVRKAEETLATVFRQISMNRFEHAMHTERREKGEITTDRMGELWIETQRDMFGGSVNMTDNYRRWWSYVPHFLQTPGYVYAYSFGELLVLALYKLYEEEGADFIPKYVDLLAAGDSDYPDKLLAKVGVDLNDPAFWGKGIVAIRELIEQEEALAKELYPDKF